MPFLRYLLKPGYVLTMVNIALWSILFAAGFMLAGQYKIAMTIIGCAIAIIVASVLGSFLRYTRHRSYRNAAMEQRLRDNASKLFRNGQDKRV